MKKNYSLEILIISVFTLTVTFLWIYLSVYKVFKKSERPILKPNEIQLLVPKLDDAVFSELKKRKTQLP